MLDDIHAPGTQEATSAEIGYTARFRRKRATR
jgi:hypothetical protein